MNSRRTLLLAAGAASAAPFISLAQPAFPARPVRIIIPFAAGGPTDVVARLIADRLSALMGQPFVVDARPGGGGAIAAEAVARAAPDGHTLLIGTATTHAVNPSIPGRKLPFDPITSFAPIAQIARVPIVLTLGPALEARDLRAFITLLRARSGQLNYGSSGTGSMGHLASVLLLRQLGVEATHVPYRGSAPMITDLAGGQLHFASDALASAVPFVRDGRVRALAIATPERARALPDCPTFAEAGLPGYQAYTWNVVFAPASTPQPIIQSLNAALNQVVSESAVASRLEEMGQPAVVGTTPEQTAAFVASELTKWAPIVAASGATPS
jgi:tripartite-type tricarboxylate transporter receptor subunit TctC